MPVKHNNFKANDKPVDPNVDVPPAVKRAAAAADAAMAAAYPVDLNAPQLPPDPNLPAPLADDTIKIVEANPVQKLPPQVTAQQLPEETWEHKFNSMKGQWQRSDALNQQLAARLETLENMLATAQAAPPVPEPSITPTKYITLKEEEEFGPEMVDVMRRAAREVATPEVESLRANMRALEAKLNGTTQVVEHDARTRMRTDLDRALPEWHEVNVLPEFHSWLALPDPFSGVTRKKLLTDAYEANKTSQVLAFFKGFVSELAATQPPEVQPAAASPRPGPTKPSLESLAAPGRARTAASVTPAAEKQTIYTSDINAFYAAKRKGYYNGREKEFEAAERELQVAMQEGRVVTNT